MSLGDKKRIFAIIPRNRYVMSKEYGKFKVEGIYWLRYVTLMYTAWNGWTAFDEYNDQRSE